MTQNVYDDDGFFAAYAQLPRSVEGLDGAPEWPALRALLPDVAGRRVLDLGCGYGWFCRWAAAQGAAEVVGVDVSEKMLARAMSWPEPDGAASGGGAAVRYVRQDLDALDLDAIGPVDPPMLDLDALDLTTPSDGDRRGGAAVVAGRFDLAYSSLVLHYLDDLPKLLSTVHDALAPGGSFVASVEHPIFTAPSVQAFVTLDDGRTVWPVDGYLDEGPRDTEFLVPGVRKHHRSFGTYVRALVGAGFTLTDVVDWGPDEAWFAGSPERAREYLRPMFLLIAAERD